jgi:TonB family protein
MAVSHTLTGPSTHDPEELNLLPWHEPITARRVMPAAIGSAVFHIIAVTLWITLPEMEFNRYSHPITPTIKKSVTIILPRNFELTQKDPNQGKVSHELDIRSMRQAAQPQAPRRLPPSPPPGPIAQAPKPTILPAIEAPKIEAPKLDVPTVVPAITAVAPRPATTPEKPKLTFEDIGAGPARATTNPNRALPTPKEVVPDPINRPPTPAGGGGTIVGDIGDSSLVNPNSVHAPSPGDAKSNLQLLSDPKGVDFKPYMIQVLTAVRRNWLAIIPETARMGRRGRVVIQFAIDRSGAVPKVVIAEPTGADILDRAAVAAISASVPLPPLPKEYTGDQIRLQLAFSYNMPAR